jgi:hypothetical protein
MNFGIRDGEDSFLAARLAAKFGMWSSVFITKSEAHSKEGKIHGSFVGQSFYKHGLLYF